MEEILLDAQCEKCGIPHENRKAGDRVSAGSEVIEKAVSADLIANQFVTPLLKVYGGAKGKFEVRTDHWGEGYPSPSNQFILGTATVHIEKIKKDFNCEK